MPTRQGGNLEKNGSICDRRSDLRTTTWPLASTPWTWKTFLAKSRPIVVICIADGSHFARERLMAFTLWHPDAVSGSHPPHLLSVVKRKLDLEDSEGRLLARSSRSRQQLESTPAGRCPSRAGSVV